MSERLEITPKEGPPADWRPHKNGDGIVIFALLAVLAIILASPAIQAQSAQEQTLSSADLSDARAAYTAGNYSTALKTFELLAEKGNAEAQYWLGRMYEEGLGTGAPNLTKAVGWYEKSSKAGFIDAKAHLGHLLLEEVGVLQDFSRARTLLAEAADDGDASAQFDLGRMWEHGWGGEKNLPMAYAWFEYAARQDFELAISARDRLLKTLSSDEVAEGQRLLTTLAPGVIGAKSTPTASKPPASSSTEAPDTASPQTSD